MMRKYLMVLMFIFLSVNSTCIATAASPQQEVAPYVANFNYTPDSQAAPGSGGVTFAIGKTVYRCPADSKIIWYKFPQIANLPDAARQDLSKLLTAKGFSVHGPFDSYDLIPYQDKKVIDLYLTPIIELSVLTEDVYDITDFKIEVTGKIILELREITTRELMWTKSIPFTKFGFPYVLKEITWEDRNTYRYVNDKTIKKPVESLKFGTVNMNGFAKGIEKQYPELMATISKLIDPEEMGIIKKQCQELKSKRGY